MIIQGTVRTEIDQSEGGAGRGGRVKCEVNLTVCCLANVCRILVNGASGIHFQRELMCLHCYLFQPQSSQLSDADGRSTSVSEAVLKRSFDSLESDVESQPPRT